MNEKTFWEFYGYLLLLAMGAVIGITLIGCGFFKPKPYVTSTYIEYDSDLVGDYRDSDTMAQIYEQLLECAEVTVPIPPPKLKVMGCEVFENCDVNGVDCDGVVMAGCYDPNNNTVILPANHSISIVQHEMIHHLCAHVPELNCSAVESQRVHASPLFLKCSGISLMN